MEGQAGAPRHTSRRALVQGVAWATPLVVVGAPIAQAGISVCTVVGSIQLAASSIVSIDAVCSANSQLSTPAVPRIRVGYGKAFLPNKIEICNCTVDTAWYRFRETDTLSNFQIEINGQHNDQNATTAGYRPPFRLDPVGEQGGCQVFALTYRTSDTRPYFGGAGVPTAASAFDQVDITFTLQRNPSTSVTAPGQNDPGWTTIQTLSVNAGKVWRAIRTSAVNNSDPIDFDSCSVQNVGVSSIPSGARQAGPAAPEEESQQSPAPPASSGTGD